MSKEKIDFIKKNKNYCNLNSIPYLKTQLVLCDQSNNNGSIDVKMEKSS